jgi:glycosyltransferase involved in cell wall biosynthesis
MRFTIVTPSYNSSRWLKLCIPSVADQGDVVLEHIVQDSCSTDGTQDWLSRDPRVTAVIEKDKGMYDAVNRGYRRARGELLAYVNCDEQYLPGALHKACEFLERNPGVDVVFGDVIVVDEKGGYLCERRALVPQWLHTRIPGNLSYLTAACFLRRSLLERFPLYFNSDLRDLGDAEWTLRLIESGARMATLGAFTSIFTETGINMNLGGNAMKERVAFHNAAPAWARVAAPLGRLHFRLRRLMAGHYRHQPHEYSIYTADSPDRRKTFQVSHPTHRWIRPSPVETKRDA